MFTLIIDNEEIRFDKNGLSFVKARSLMKQITRCYIKGINVTLAHANSHRMPQSVREAYIVAAQCIHDNNADVGLNSVLRDICIEHIRP